MLVGGVPRECPEVEAWGGGLSSSGNQEGAGEHRRLKGRWGQGLDCGLHLPLAGLASPWWLLGLTH